MFEKVYKNRIINMDTPFKIDIDNDDEYDELEDKSKDSSENSNDIFEGYPEQQEVEFEEKESDAQNEASAIVESAKEEARIIISNAREEIEAEKTRIFEETINKAYEEALQKAKAEYEDLLNEAVRIRQNAENEYNSILSGMEQDILNIIFEITQKVLEKEIKCDREYIIGLVKQGILKCRNRENLIIKVSAEDYDIIQNNKEVFQAFIDGTGIIEIKKGISLKNGACLIETPCGTVDCGVDTKFKKIREEFEKILTGGKILEQQHVL